MSNNIGRFEILSDLSRSAVGGVFKASDPESGQTIALKTLQPDVLGEQYASLIQAVLEEATASQVLNSHNLTQLFGAQEMDGQFCAAMEYVQGNSVATMLARKEGFSIWDLQDIARQSCQGLDHAHVKGVVHYSLEPAKIMVSWDGTVKILSFGISRMSTFRCQEPGKAPEVLHYMSPEQVRGEALDARSNIFSLGAIFYEMVTETKAFPGDDADQVRQQIVEQMPTPAGQLNRKLHPALSEVIMKALAKAPLDRYQNGQELVNDLERCKESPVKAAAKRPAASASPASPQKPAVSGSTAPTSVRKQQPQRASSISASVSALASAPTIARPEKPAVAEAVSKVESKPANEFAVTPSPVPPAEEPVAAIAAAESVPAEEKAFVPSWRAAAAGFGGSDANSTSGELSSTPKLDASAQFISTCVKASVEAFTQEEESMSAAAAKPQPAAPKIAVDPMMQEAETAGGAHSVSFSEINELPPLKEAYVPAPPPAETQPAEPPPATMFQNATPEKPRVQPQAVAKQAARKAVTEIKKTPPKLFIYSIAAAVAVILLVVVGMVYRIHSENAEDNPETSASAPPSSTQQANSQPATPVAPPQAGSTSVQAETPEAARKSAVSVTPKYKSKKVKPPVAAPLLVPGQLTINSTPEGAEVSLDDRHDPSWVTPFNMSGLMPGQHIVKVNKSGFSGETRSIEVASGSKSFLVVQLAPLTATLSVTSEPAGAAVLLDGRDTGRVTPAQISIDKAGTHTVLVKKQGYLDETTTANLVPGQLLHFSPSLKTLGATDDIKIGGGKLKRMFGGNGDTAGMGTVSVKTQPKGAQVAINNRILDKLTPLEFYLNPGTYVVDITATGYKDVHRVITVEKNGKVAIEENLDRQ
jgi:serine/threonine-protein kinase